MASKYDYIRIVQKSKITANELQALFNFLRKAPTDSKDKKYKKLVLDYWYDNLGERGSMDLDASHQRKGIDYLRKSQVLKDGSASKNSQFGRNELEILEQVSEVSLSGLQDVSSMWSDGQDLRPIFMVSAKDGYFEYYYNNGKTILH